LSTWAEDSTTPNETCTAEFCSFDYRLVLDNNSAIDDAGGFKTTFPGGSNLILNACGQSFEAVQALPCPATS
jgi:hypothetical protein